jgi:hypothetical protein
MQNNNKQSVVNYVNIIRKRPHVYIVQVSPTVLKCNFIFSFVPFGKFYNMSAETVTLLLSWGPVTVSLLIAVKNILLLLNIYIY